VEFLNT